MKKFFQKRLLIFGLIIIGIFIWGTTYALIPKKSTQKVWTHILRIDEDAYGDTVFDSSKLSFLPILDQEVEDRLNNVIHIDFQVGGSSFNNEDNIVYDISLNDLKVDCELLSPYLKWKLIKNGVEISSGSFDYQFDTIVRGLLVLTPIQQDLVKYSKDKKNYDRYSFYLWLSDSCQSENLGDCLDTAEDQTKLLNKRLQGKIEVELYAKRKEPLVRKPSNTLPVNTCVSKDSDHDDTDH